jgi:hypothetical protein
MKLMKVLALSFVISTTFTMTGCVQDLINNITSMFSSSSGSSSTPGGAPDLKLPTPEPEPKPVPEPEPAKKPWYKFW